VIRSIADGQDDVALVLEDDVDMELDIRQRLLGVWDSLPSVWDIVFLGRSRGLIL
jgi:GR25 family glycosyltransferase involved in LPS biosynthesis